MALTGYVQKCANSSLKRQFAVKTNSGHSFQKAVKTMTVTCSYTDCCLVQHNKYSKIYRKFDTKQMSLSDKYDTKYTGVTFAPQNIHRWAKITMHTSFIPVGVQPNKTTVI